MKTSTLAALLAGLLIFRPKPKPKPKPKPAPKKEAPPYFPFVYTGDGVAFAKAQREYAEYFAGTLPKESYPVEHWVMREDVIVSKLDPGRFVEVKLSEAPGLFQWLQKKVTPSWATVKFAALGAVILVAPEVMAWVGIESAAAYTAVQVTSLAYQIASVIRAFQESGTGAGVAEIAAQVYSIQSPGLALGVGELVKFFLNTWGIRIAVRAGLSPFVD